MTTPSQRPPSAQGCAKRVVLLVVAWLVTAVPAVAQSTPPGYGDHRDICETITSVHACGPDGFITGAGGACAATPGDLDCVRVAWDVLVPTMATGPWTAGWCSGAIPEPEPFPLVRCDDATAVAAGLVGPPVPPPTLGEALATCPIPPAATIGHDPYLDGLTGLETRLWASPAGPLAGGGVVRGHAVVCTLTPTEWRFGTGDGHSASADRPGGPHPDHAVAHVYETRNEPGEDYTLTLTVTWQRATNYGADLLATTTTKPYHVVEIRSSLTG